MIVEQPRVVIDARMTFDGGIGTYLQALVPRIARLRPQWRLTILGDTTRLEALGWAELPNARLKRCTVPIFSAREQIALPLLIPRDTRLFWAPNYDVPLLMSRSTRLALTIHDVNHLALPDLLGGFVRRSYAAWLFRTAARRASRILFDSQFTRREAMRLLGHSADRGTVVHLGVDARWQRAKERAAERPMTEPYFVYVGNVKRHKNVPFLVRAFARIMHGIPHRLVILGRTTGLRVDPDVAGEIAKLGDRVRLLGEVDDASVPHYVAHAEALVTASLYEGFGLPALEAMAAGCPCIVSRAGSLPEVCGDAACYADPRDEQSFAAAMLHVAQSPSERERLASAGRARAAAFSWDRAADATVNVLDDALA